MHEASCNLEPATHAPGEIAYGLIGPLRKVHRFQKVCHDLFAPRPRHAVKLGEELHIFFAA